MSVHLRQASDSLGNEVNPNRAGKGRGVYVFRPVLFFEFGGWSTCSIDQDRVSVRDRSASGWPVVDSSASHSTLLRKAKAGRLLNPSAVLPPRRAGKGRLQRA